jgi:hypothetical protein
MRRYTVNTKRFIQGGKRRLYIPKSFKVGSDSTTIVEGGSDTAAGLALTHAAYPPSVPPPLRPRSQQASPRLARGSGQDLGLAAFK